jgi:hypothetical protein
MSASDSDDGFELVSDSEDDSEIDHDSHSNIKKDPEPAVDTKNTEADPEPTVESKEHHKLDIESVSDTEDNNAVEPVSDSETNHESAVDPAVDPETNHDIEYGLDPLHVKETILEDEKHPSPIIRNEEVDEELLHLGGLLKIYSGPFDEDWSDQEIDEDESDNEEYHHRSSSNNTKNTDHKTGGALNTTNFIDILKQFIPSFTHINT